MKQENTNLPLWKVLNEQRTQGEWRWTGGYITSSEKPRLCLAKFIDYGNTKKLEDAQYTALAVNNFAQMAELLWNADNVFNYQKQAEDTGEISMGHYNPILHAKIKETLNRIS